MPTRSLINNLRIKVMLLFLMVALVPLGIVAAFALESASDLIMNMVSNQLENVANDKAALLERWISERKADLRVVADSSVLQSMHPAQIAPFLNLVRTNYEVYNGFVVIGRDGGVVFNSLGRPGPDLGEDWYRHSLAGRLYLSEISLDPEKKESVFRISAPIFGDAGAVQGVVCATVGTYTILSILLKVSLGETGECYLVDKEGTFLAHKQPRRILTENIAQSESFKNIFGSGYRKRIYVDYRGIEVLGTSRPIAGTDWYLVVEQDRDEAFQSADRLKRYIYLVIGFSILGVVLLAGLVSYSVVNPIHKLSLAADALARGKFESSLIETRRADEIGMLSRAFASMAEQLQARQQSLEAKADLAAAELQETDLKLKKTELAAARSEQLAALGRLAAGVTHEIRTPLTSLKLFLESVQGEIEISPECREDFQVAMDQIRRIEATINRFLDFAKPQEPIFSFMEVGQLIEEALLVVRPRAIQQETTVNVTIDQGLPKIRGDQKQLGESLLNLLVNALEAMPHGGRLLVAASLAQFSLSSAPLTGIRIDISDTGPGIAPEDIPNLFDPFFTTKASGTGLGLSIVRSTVQGHGGEVRVESLADAGTTFSIFLPLRDAQDRDANGKDPDR